MNEVKIIFRRKPIRLGRLRKSAEKSSRVDTVSFVFREQNRIVSDISDRGSGIECKKNNNEGGTSYFVLLNNHPQSTSVYPRT